jgi:hypothetical protein
LAYAVKAGKDGVVKSDMGRKSEDCKGNCSILLALPG